MIVPIKKERIFRVLSTQENLTITKISEQTKLAKSYVSKVVNELKKKGIVFGAEKIHVNYDKLIREWGILKRKIFESTQPLMIDILIPDRLKLIIKNYAISGSFAEMLVQGESSGKPIIVYISEEEMEKRKSQIYKLGPIGKGFVHIYVYDEDILRYKWEIKGWKIVSIPQLCADLIAEGMFADLGIKLFERWLNAGRRI
jgi:DNA-binding transcriptional regulator LsrR (DeoR family)